MLPSKRFAAWIACSGRTRVDVAQALGVSPSMVSHMCAGRKRPNIDTAAQIELLTARAPGGPILVVDWAQPTKGRRAA